MEILSNATGIVLNELTVSYDVVVLNDQDRASRIDFMISADGIAFSTVDALVYVSPAGRDAAASWKRVARFCRIALPAGLNPDRCLWLRWRVTDAGGSGSRDELGLDNVNVVLDRRTGLVMTIR